MIGKNKGEEHLPTVSSSGTLFFFCSINESGYCSHTLPWEKNIESSPKVAMRVTVSRAALPCGKLRPFFEALTVAHPELWNK